MHRYPIKEKKTVKSLYRHLDNLYLCDYDDSSELGADVLVGAEYCFSFMSGRCIKGDEPRSPVAL